MPICVDCGKETERKADSVKRCNKCLAERKKARVKSWRSRNRKRHNETNKIWQQKNKRVPSESEIIRNRERHRKDRLKNIEAYRKRFSDWHNRNCQSMTEKYIARLTGISPEEASGEFFEIKRLQLKLRRLCREKC